MTGFNSLLYETMKKSKLKRVLIKCDPRLSGYIDFSSATSYEGYVLEESHETISITILKNDLPTVTLPISLKDTIQPLDEPEVTSDKLSDFKQYISKLFKQDDPLLKYVNNSSSVEEIESILLQNNVNTENFLRVLRKFINGKILNEQIEAPTFFSNLKQFGKNAVSGAFNSIANAGETASKLQNLSNDLSQGNYGKIAKNVSGQWNEAKEMEAKRLLKTFEWPQGYPKQNTNIKIINRNNEKINNKFLNVTKVSKTGKNTIYYCNLLSVSTRLGAIGAIITIMTDQLDDHTVNVKFTEGNTISHTLNSNSINGDTYILQFNARTHQFELCQNILGRDVIAQVKCQKDTPVGVIVDNLMSIARVGSLKSGQFFRGKLITPPVYNDKYGWVAHATPE